MDYKRAKFLVKQRIKGFDVPESPHFDSEETTAWFLDRLANSKCYLEYGTGGSTYVAARLGVSFVAVDSDPFFLRAVAKKIRQDGYQLTDAQILHHADIGPTGYWGKPYGRVSTERLEKFRHYSDPPSRAFLDKFGLPDLILVDGRFRVACALKAIQMQNENTEWTLVVDDYVGRDLYQIIEKFAVLEQVVGRMAIFTSKKNIEATHLESAITEYETDSR